MPAVEQSAQPGEQSAIRGSQGRSDDLTAKDGDFVAEHDDLDRQLVAVPPAQTHQLEDPGEGQVEKREGHVPVSSSRAVQGKSCSRYPDDILGTHKFVSMNGRPLSAVEEIPNPFPISAATVLLKIAVAN
jgi:hypothetical protein